MNALLEHIEVAGGGATATDFYFPKGRVGKDYQAGVKKSDWDKIDQARYARVRRGPHERHSGGNINNLLAYFASLKLYRSVRMLGVVGTDPYSMEALAHMQEMGIDTSHMRVVDGYKPSVSVIERKGNDRMIRGRPRDDLTPHLDKQHIAEGLAGSGLVAVSSLKSTLLTQRVISNAPPDARITFNPGSSDYADLQGLRNTMEQRRPMLLALNGEELGYLYNREIKGVKDAEEHARRASLHHADYVLATLGNRGLLLANDGDAIFRPADIVKRPVDPSGAGDRAHAVAAHGLILGWGPEEILGQVAESTARVVSHIGAHGDLYAHSAAA